MVEQEFMLKFQSLPEALKQDMLDFLDLVTRKYGAQPSDKTPE